MRITDYPSLAQLAIDTVLPVVDVHDLTQSAAGTTKQLALASLLPGLVMGADPTGGTDSAGLVNSRLSAVGLGILPPGTFLINSPLTMPPGGRLAGAGKGLTKLVIGSGFSGSQAVVAPSGSDKAHLSDLAIVGPTSTVASNPAVGGIAVTGSAQVEIQNVFFQYVNGWPIEVEATSTKTCVDLMISKIIARNCAGGIHLLGNSGTSFLGEHQLSDITMQQIGASSGPAAGLDALLAEDVSDVIVQALNIGIANGMTGSPVHVKGACATFSLSNPDFGSPGAATAGAGLHVEPGSNGTPADVTITGGTIEGGSAGVQVDAGQDVRVIGTRVHQAWGDGLQVNGGEFSATAVYLAANNQSGSSTAADINTSAATTGNSRFYNVVTETGVGSGTGLVVRPVSTSGRSYYFGCAFIGSGGTPSTVFTGTPQIIRNCVGYNPRGSISAPTITASPFTTSTSQQDVTIIFTAINSLTAFKIAGTAVGVLPVAGVPYTIPARTSLELDYSGTAPTWQWFGN